MRTPANFREPQDALLLETEHFQWIPGLGAFVEGYSLIVSKDHVLNIGVFGDRVIEELEELILKVKSTLYELYDSPSIIFEHGTMGFHQKQRAGGCVEHHHIHIMPIDLPIVPTRMKADLSTGRVIKNLMELKKLCQEKTPYLYLQTSIGESYVFETSILPRQYMRQIVASEIGCPQDWNWTQRLHLISTLAF